MPGRWVRGSVRDHEPPPDNAHADDVRRAPYASLGAVESVSHASFYLVCTGATYERGVPGARKAGISDPRRSGDQTSARGCALRRETRDERRVARAATWWNAVVQCSATLGVWCARVRARG